MPAHDTRVAARSLTLAVAALLLTACGSRGSGARPDETPAPSRSEGRSTDQQTSGVTTLNGDDMKQVGAQRIEEYLNGRVPGLQVLRNESGQYSIRIRGAASLGQSDEEPLVVIDGMPVPQGGNSEALRGIDPREVARVQVLKDASQTAMYGSRGANGVLLIRTRSAARR
jgi:TonB-dependent SusC/RagA subfamily outer membrane receptor